MFLRHTHPFWDVFSLLWALCGVHMWHIKRLKDKFYVCQDNVTPHPPNQNNTTYEVRLFSIFVTLLIRKMDGFVVKIRERDSKGFSPFSSLAIGSLWDPRLIRDPFCAPNPEWGWQVSFLPFLGITVKAELSRAAVHPHVQHRAEPGLWHPPALHTTDHGWPIITNQLSQYPRMIYNHASFLSPTSRFWELPSCQQIPCLKKDSL